MKRERRAQVLVRATRGDGMRAAGVEVMNHNFDTLDLAALQLVTGGQARDRSSQLPHTESDRNGSVVPAQFPVGGGGGIGQAPYQVMR